MAAVPSGPSLDSTPHYTQGYLLPHLSRLSLNLIDHPPNSSGLASVYCKSNADDELTLGYAMMQRGETEKRTCDHFDLNEDVHSGWQHVTLLLINSTTLYILEML
jgi:hypothetical protein